MAAPVALVSGGTGFVGSHLVRHLQRRGWCVHAIVRSSSRTADLDARLGRDRVHAYGLSGDSIRDVVRVTAPTAVFHLASLFVGEHQPEDVDRLIESNIRFGANLMESASAEAVPFFINTSTSWQHYEGEERRPANLYAATKQAYEDILSYYVDTRQIRALTLVLFDTYGPDDRRPKLFNALAQAVRGGRTLKMSPGEQMLDLVHVDDVATAYERAYEILRDDCHANGARFAVASGRAIRLKDVVGLYEQVSQRTVPLEWGGRPYREREVMRPWDGQRLPGWTPRISLEDGIRRMIVAPALDAGEGAK